MSAPFQFKQFTIQQDKCAMKVGTDALLLGSWANFDHCKHIVDIGSGSGVLSLMLAQRFHQANILGIDITESAVAQSKENVLSSPFSNRIKITHNRFQQIEQQCDGIICNPPFFHSKSDTKSPDRQLARQAIDFDFPDLFDWCSTHLSENGSIAMVYPFLDFQMLTKIAFSKGLSLMKLTYVYAVKGQTMPTRVLLQWCKQNCATSFDTITIQNSDGTYTEDYKELTKGFYLNF